MKKLILALSTTVLMASPDEDIADLAAYYASLK